MAKKYLLVSLLLWNIGQVFAQFPPSVQWKYTYGALNSGDYSYAMEHTSDGGYIMAGFAAGYNGDVSQGGNDAWVVKLDANGLLVWEEIYGADTAAMDEFYDIRQTSDGGYVMAGYRDFTSSSLPWVVKIDANGNVQWEKSYTLPPGEKGVFEAIWQTSDGGYVMAGNTGTNKLTTDVLVTRISATGNLLWQKIYGGSNYDIAYDIKQTPDGGYIVAAYTDSSDGDVSQSYGSGDIWLLKLSANGNLDWEKTYGGSGSEVFGYLNVLSGNDLLQLTADGGYVVVGGTTSTDGDVSGPLYGSNDVWLLKLKANGTINWEQNYGGASADWGQSIQQTLDGGYLIGAAAWSSNGQLTKNEGVEDIWTFKTDSSGVFSWGRSLGSYNNDLPTDVAQVSGCEFVVAGLAGGGGGDVSQINFGHDFWIIKFQINLNPPVAPSPQNFCWRQQPVIDSLDVQGDTSLGFPVTFNWYNDKADIVPLAGNTPLANGEKYYVAQVIDGCESPLDSVVVNIVEDIIPEGLSPQSFCEDDNASIADFQVSGQNLLWYQGPNSPTLLPPNTPLTDGETYYVSQTIDACESSRLGIKAEVFPPPNAFPLSQVVACDTDGNGSGEFFLPDLDNAVSGGATNVVVTYHASLSGAENAKGVLPDNYSTQSSPEIIYARILDAATGCDSIVEVELVFSPIPEIMGLEDLTGCDDGNNEAVFDLTQNNDDILGNQEPQNLKITYHETQVGADSGNNAIPDSKNYTSTGKTVFVRLENTQTKCFDTGSFALFVDPRPNIDDTPIALEVCSDEGGGNTATIDLTQFDVQINPGSPPNTAVVYYANASEHAAGNPIKSPENYTTSSNPQTLIAAVMEINTGCPSVGFVEIEINVNDRPVVDLSSYDGMALCWDSDSSTPVEGGNYEPVILETGLNESDYIFEWTLDGKALSQTSPNLEATEPGDYEVTVTDTDGITTTCTSTASATIIQANPPEFDLSHTSQAVANEHGILVSNINGKGSFAFRLDDGSWLPLGKDANFLFEKVAPGMHVVYGRSLEGCGATAHSITLIGYPKFFTPNNDGQNDRWNIIGLKNQSQAKILIFDRYGKLLTSLNPAAPGWDGTYNGKRMPSNDYWFRVDFSETLADGTERPQVFKAHFTLKR